MPLIRMKFQIGWQSSLGVGMGLDGKKIKKLM
jgi:hypothetical protein